MCKKLVNLTLSLVSEEIENILQTYAEYPYQQIFTNPDLRQELVAYVLSHVPNNYVAIEESEDLSIRRLVTSVSSEQQLNLEKWIHLGIDDIMVSNNCLNKPRRFQNLTSMPMLTNCFY